MMDIKKSFNKRLFLFSKLFKVLIKPNSKWLDAGCGSGALSRELARHGACVDSIDGSREMIMHAIEDSKKYMTSISYKKFNFIRYLPYLDSSYDGILSSSVIEYVDNPKRMLSEFYRVTNDNGILIISAPNTFSLIRVTQNVIRLFSKFVGRDDFNYLLVSKNSYSYKEFACIVKESGYTIQSVKKFSPILNRLFSLTRIHSLTIVIAIKNKI